MPSISQAVAEILAIACGVLLVIIIGLSLWLWVDGNRITSLKAENANLTTANGLFKTAADEQNAAIKKLKDDEQALTDAAAKAQREAVEKDAALTASMTALQKIKPATNACAAADTLLVHYIGGK